MLWNTLLLLPTAMRQCRGLGRVTQTSQFGVTSFVRFVSVTIGLTARPQQLQDRGAGRGSVTLLLRVAIRTFRSATRNSRRNKFTSDLNMPADGAAGTSATGPQLPEHMETQRTQVICGPDLNYHVRTVAWQARMLASC